MATHVTGGVIVPLEGPPVDEPGTTFIVVVGFTNCSLPFVVVSVGGWLSSPAPTRHTVEIQHAGGPFTVGDFTLDKNSLTGMISDPGVSEGSAWQLQNGSFGNPNTYFEPNRPVNANTNGPGQRHQPAPQYPMHTKK